MANFDCLLSAYFLLATGWVGRGGGGSLRPGAFIKDISPTNSLGTRLGWVGIVLNTSKLYFFHVTRYHHQIKHTMDKILL